MMNLTRWAKILHQSHELHLSTQILAKLIENKNLITSKSSMIGVLGVVPEENDSEGEENQLRYTNYSQFKETTSK
jgi:hypothetical protein